MKYKLGFFSELILCFTDVYMSPGLDMTSLLFPLCHLFVTVGHIYHILC